MLRQMLGAAPFQKNAESLRIRHSCAPKNRLLFSLGTSPHHTIPHQRMEAEAGRGSPEGLRPPQHLTVQPGWLTFYLREGMNCASGGGGFYFQPP